MRSQPETRRQQIIDAAIQTLAEIGLVDFTFNAVATRADISPGLAVHYFGDKDGLLEAAFRSVAQKLNNYAAARLRLAQGPRA
ncbi:MAG: betaine-aldehyde dehydrogenase, partial [Pseudomonadota bacterium]